MFYIYLVLQKRGTKLKQLADNEHKQYVLKFAQLKTILLLPDKKKALSTQHKPEVKKK